MREKNNKKERKTTGGKKGREGEKEGRRERE